MAFCDCMCHDDPIGMVVHPGEKCVCNGGTGTDEILPDNYQPRMKKTFK